MNTLDVHFKNSMTPQEFHRRLGESHDAELLDVRTPAEYTAVHVMGARLLPLDELNAVSYLNQRPRGEAPLYVLCESGTRSAKAVEKFRRAGFEGCVQIEGGMQAWLAAELPVERGESAVLPLMRQVQIVVGAVSALGAALALVVNVRFAIIPLITGCGLLFAGLTGLCGLALVLARMPWNRRTNCSSSAGCQLKQ